MVRHRKGLSSTVDDMHAVDKHCDQIEREYHRYSEETLTTDTARDNEWFNCYREADTHLSVLEVTVESQDERIKKLEKALGKKVAGVVLFLLCFKWDLIRLNSWCGSMCPSRFTGGKGVLNQQIH